METGFIFKHIICKMNNQYNHNNEARRRTTSMNDKLDNRTDNADRNAELVHADCDLCGSAETNPLYKKDGLTIARCAGCGLARVNPRPTDTYLKKEIYNEGYFNAERGFGIENAFGNEAVENASRAERIFKRIEKMAAPGKMIDVGCASGVFMREGQRRGWSARGIEISEYAAEQSRRRFNLDVSSCDFIQADLPAGEFDLVLMMDLIEHLSSPAKGVEKAYEILKPGGLLVIETPNLDGAAARFLGAEWGLIAPLHHLFYFTASTLKRLVSERGFDIASIEYPLWGLSDLLLSAGSFRKAGLPVGDKQKQIARTKLKFARDAARSAANAIDRAMISPFTRYSNGNAISLMCVKPMKLSSGVNPK